MADKEPITVELKKTLDTPINRGDYTVTKRDLLRVHFSDTGVTKYYKEGNGERGEFEPWTEATKAAFEAFQA